MRVHELVLAFVMVSSVAACGDQAGSDETPGRTGITGLVHLGPQCAVQTAGGSCSDQPARHATVTVAEKVSHGSSDGGDPVAVTTTTAGGTFSVDVAPGTYVVTADAGLSCERVVVTVPAEGYFQVDLPCDTGIR
jgi:hypothetical protein